MSIARKILMGSSGGKKSTYVDDVFSTYVYQGNETARAINNGIDLSSKGGLVWVKSRNDTHQHHLIDTVRGANQMIASDSDSDQATVANRITGFNSDGFNLGTAGQVNGTSAYNYSSWTFRNAEGFFDIVTYTGNSTGGRQIAHNLGCTPGCIMVKRLDDPVDWAVWHKASVESNATNTIILNSTGQSATNNSYFDNGSTPPTATNFTVHTSNRVNQNGASYVAYVFAGNIGDSVHFDGSGDYIRSGIGNAFTYGTNDFTIECWVKFEDTSPSRGVYQHNSLMTSNYGNYPAVGHDGNNWVVYGNGGSNSYTGGGGRNANQWYHLAHVRHSGTTKLYVDGVEKVSFTDTYSYGTNRILIGGYYNSSYLMKGNITNWRLVKHRALYTSNFTPPTTQLGKTYDGDGNMDTFFLCCNTGSPTGYTIDDTGNGITSNADPQQSSDVPSTFGQLSALFGEEEDKNIIKCGSYTGNNNSNGPEIDLGWEPQWVLLKDTQGSSNWVIHDTMRGWVNASSNNVDARIFPNTTSGESSFYTSQPSPRGFKITTTLSDYNENNHTYLYIAIRRPDGYVGKPPEAGTDVFTLANGLGGAGFNFTAGFPVDYIFFKGPNNASDWVTSARLIQGYELEVNKTDTASYVTTTYFDSNTQAIKAGYYGSTTQAWLWKRHAGFDVVAYKGDSQSNRRVNHSLGKIPEMIWVKNTDTARDWVVYHKGLNGGTNPQNYYLVLNGNSAEASTQYIWSQYPPTTTQFEVDATGVVNDNNERYLSLLFASVAGISKVGYYDGTGSDQTISLGFNPRFIFFKCSTNNRDWTVFDTVRGISSGNDPALFFNLNSAQYSAEDYVEPVSNGIIVKGSSVAVNENNHKYIYYAHA